MQQTPARKRKSPAHFHRPSGKENISHNYIEVYDSSGSKRLILEHHIKKIKQCIPENKEFIELLDNDSKIIKIKTKHVQKIDENDQDKQWVQAKDIQGNNIIVRKSAINAIMKRLKENKKVGEIEPIIDYSATKRFVKTNTLFDHTVVYRQYVPFNFNLYEDGYVEVMTDNRKTLVKRSMILKTSYSKEDITVSLENKDGETFQVTTHVLDEIKNNTNPDDDWVQVEDPATGKEVIIKKYILKKINAKIENNDNSPEETYDFDGNYISLKAKEIEEKYDIASLLQKSEDQPAEEQVIPTRPARIKRPTGKLLEQEGRIYERMAEDEHEAIFDNKDASQDIQITEKEKPSDQPIPHDKAETDKEKPVETYQTPEESVEFRESAQEPNEEEIQNKIQPSQIENVPIKKEMTQEDYQHLQAPFQSPTEEKLESEETAVLEEANIREEHEVAQTQPEEKENKPEISIESTKKTDKADTESVLMIKELEETVPPDPDMTVHFVFSIKYLVKYGQAVYVTGSVDELNKWNISRAIRLENYGNDVWVRIVPIKYKNFPFEFNYFVSGYHRGNYQYLIGRSNTVITKLHFRVLINQNDNIYRVMSFNSRYLNSIDGVNVWRNRKALIWDILTRSNCDIICLQEISQNQLSDFSEFIKGLYSDIGKPRTWKPQDEQCKILVNRQKLFVEDCGQFWLSKTPEKGGSISFGNYFPRVCTWARLTRIFDVINRREGKLIYMFNTHLDHISIPSRSLCIDVLLRQVQRITQPDKLKREMIVFITGSFYSEDNDECIVKIKSEGYTSVSQEAGNEEKTFHEFTGIGKLKYDHIFYKTFNHSNQSSTPQLKQYRLITENTKTNGDMIYLSDHFPIFAELEEMYSNDTL